MFDSPVRSVEYLDLRLDGCHVCHNKLSMSQKWAGRYISMMCICFGEDKVIDAGTRGDQA